MRGRTKLYQVIVIFITICSVGAMMYFKNNLNSLNMGYDNPQASDLGDDKYLGYIFEDYNKQVNLEFSDNILPDENGNINASSLSALDMEYTPDNVRAVKSERVVDERAVMDEVLEGERSIFSPQEIAFFYDCMDQPDKTVFLNVAGKLDTQSLELVKELFSSVSDDEIEDIVQELKSKLTDDECEFLTNLIYKYGE